MALLNKTFFEQEPLGTIILVPFEIIGYTRDCDGSAMAKVAALDKDGKTTGWRFNGIGLYSDSMVVLESPKELKDIFAKAEKKRPKRRK